MIFRFSARRLLMGGARNYENAYLWLYINDNIDAGERSLHSTAVGCFAQSYNASIRTASCSNYADAQADSYAGGFAIPFIEL